MSGIITENLNMILNKIDESASLSGRDPKGITLVGVTKTVDADRIRQLLSLGVRHLGENRVQEFLTKYPVLSSVENKPVWHMIGHLQTNKVKPIMDKVSLIHSVDSLRLANEIGKHAIRLGIIMNVLVEINAAGELSKSGVSFNEARELVKSLSGIGGVLCRGLMTVPPYAEDGESNRDYFKKMKDALEEMNEAGINETPMDILSMGMTSDYEAAIQEGATIIRVGTGIFGSR